MSPLRHSLMTCFQTNLAQPAEVCCNRMLAAWLPSKLKSLGSDLHSGIFSFCVTIHLLFKIPSRVFTTQGYSWIKIKRLVKKKPCSKVFFKLLTFGIWHTLLVYPLLSHMPKSLALSHHSSKLPVDISLIYEPPYF